MTTGRKPAGRGGREKRRRLLLSPVARVAAGGVLLISLAAAVDGPPEKATRSGAQLISLAVAVEGPVEKTAGRAKNAPRGLDRFFERCVEAGVFYRMPAGVAYFQAARGTGILAPLIQPRLRPPRVSRLDSDPILPVAEVAYARLSRVALKGALQEAAPVGVDGGTAVVSSSPTMPTAPASPAARAVSVLAASGPVSGAAALARSTPWWAALGSMALSTVAAAWLTVSFVAGSVESMMAPASVAVPAAVQARNAAASGAGVPAVVAPATPATQVAAAPALARPAPAPAAPATATPALASKTSPAAPSAPQSAPKPSSTTALPPVAARGSAAASSAPEIGWARTLASGTATGLRSLADALPGAAVEFETKVAPAVQSGLGWVAETRPENAALRAQEGAIAAGRAIVQGTEATLPQVLRGVSSGLSLASEYAPQAGSAALGVVSQSAPAVQAGVKFSADALRGAAVQASELSLPASASPLLRAVVDQVPGVLSGTASGLDLLASKVPEAPAALEYAGSKALPIVRAILLAGSEVAQDASTIQSAQVASAARSLGLDRVAAEAQRVAASVATAAGPALEDAAAKLETYAAGGNPK